MSSSSFKSPSLWPSNDPAHPAARAEGVALALREGFDEPSFVEHHVTWGEQDRFGHVNNTHYLRYFEMGRMHFIETLDRDMPRELAQDMHKGRNVGIIVASLSIQFKRPVNHPDTLLIAVRPTNLLPDRSRFTLEHLVYSYDERAVVARGESLHVLFDYRINKRAPMGPEVQKALEKRVEEGRVQGKERAKL